MNSDTSRGPGHEITHVLDAMRSGDTEAAERLLQIVYADLKSPAAAHMARTPPGNTLQPTALVHEAYLRVFGGGGSKPAGRTEFFCAAARAMRNILVEQTRRKRALKRGGDRKRADLERNEPEFAAPSEDVVALDEALHQLEAEDPRKGDIVNLRYFAGLTTEETASVLGVSGRTIENQWRFIRHWLFKRLSDGASPG